MIRLNIDRIVLNGFTMSPSRAENLKSLIQAELQNRLSQNYTIHDVHDKEIPNFNTTSEHINESATNTRIASGITNSIMSSINSTPTK